MEQCSNGHGTIFYGPKNIVFYFLFYDHRFNR